MYLSYRNIINKFKNNDIKYGKIFEYQVYMVGITWYNISIFGSVYDSNNKQE